MIMGFWLPVNQLDVNRQTGSKALKQVHPFMLACFGAMAFTLSPCGGGGAENSLKALPCHYSADNKDHQAAGAWVAKR